MQEGLAMRTTCFALVWLIGMTGWGLAQRPDPAPTTASGTAPVPHVIGNRANGFNYQPTPGEVVPREASAGVRPSVARQTAADKSLEAIDRRLVHDEGLSSKNVPSFTTRQ
jgi:hypothetical protein